MSYIGNQPFTAAFLTDTFSGNGSTVAFTMSVAPATTSSVIVAITGVLQDPSTYSVSGTTLTFSAAPPTGTSNISVRYLGIPASGVTTTAYRTQTEFTATAGQTTFSVPSYTVGFIDVYRNGLLLGSPDFTATNGTTVVLTNAASAGDFVETVSFYVSSVLNALPNTGGTLSGNLIVNGELTTSGNTVLGDASTDTLNVGNGGLVKDASGNVGIGVTPSAWGGGYKALQIGQSAFMSRTAGSDSYIFSNSFFTGSVFRYINTAAAAYYGQDAGAHKWFNAASGTAGDAITFTSAMTLDSSGNLLVGTTSNTLGDRAVVATANNSQLSVECTTASGTVYSTIRFTQAGVAKTQLYQDHGATRFYVVNNTNGLYLAANATAWTAVSDEREKENLVPISNAVSKVASLRAVTGNYISDESKKSRAFLIAQDVQSVLPEAVDSSDPEKLGVQYTDVIPLLVAAIKEQQAIITQLQADVAALKGNS